MDTSALTRQWGRNVREARGEFWKQRDLAEVCGITPAALANIEAGKRVPRVSTMVVLAGALRRPIGELFPWPEDIPPFPQVLGKAVAS